MRRFAAITLPLLWAGCAQEISIVPKDTDPGLPVDTDIGLPLQQPDIQLSTEELRFGSLPPGCETDAQIVTITNVGDADLTVSSIELAGPGKAGFSKQGRGKVLAPNESMDVTVVFAPTLFEAYDRVRLEVASNDPDEPMVDVDLDGAGSELAYREELFVQGQTSEVDVLFAIDYSGSMSSDIANLASSFQLFIDSFVNLGLDYHIGMVTADPACPALIGPVITPETLPSPQEEFTSQSTEGACFDEAAFGSSKNALTAPAINTGYNADFLRPNATLAIVAISDEAEQSGMSASNYANWLLSMKADPGFVSFSGIVGPRSGGGIGGCADNAPRYHDAINRTGGVWGNLCNLDLTPFLTHLSFVAAGLEFKFELAEPPLNFGPNVLIVEVNGVNVPYDPVNGWTFDEASSAVVFNGTSIPQPGETILIQYPYDAECD